MFIHGLLLNKTNKHSNTKTVPTYDNYPVGLFKVIFKTQKFGEKYLIKKLVDFGN